MNPQSAVKHVVQHSGPVVVTQSEAARMKNDRWRVKSTLHTGGVGHIRASHVTDALKRESLTGYLIAGTMMVLVDDRFYAWMGVDRATPGRKPTRRPDTGGVARSSRDADWMTDVNAPLPHDLTADDVRDARLM